MKNKFKLLLFIFVLAGLLFLNTSGASAADKKYLILVQKYDGSWVGYDTNIWQVKNNKIMVNASKIAKIMEIDIKKESSSKYNIYAGANKNYFTIGKKSFVNDYERRMGDDPNPIKHTLSEAPYPYKNELYIHYAGFGYLGFHKYYSGKNAPEYQKQGYDGVLCYSRMFSIQELPEISLIKNSKSKYFFNMKRNKPKEEANYTIKASNVKSSQANYLLIVKGQRFSDPIAYNDCTIGLEGYIETLENGSLMINGDHVDAYYGTSAVTWVCERVNENKFNLKCEDLTLSFELGSKKYTIKTTDGKKETLYSEEVPYISKHNLCYYIDLSIFYGLYSFGKPSVYQASINQKTFIKNGYTGAILVCEPGYSTDLVPFKKIVIKKAEGNYTKKELEKLPSTMINGVKIYGTTTFNDPAKKVKPTDYSNWGYLNDLYLLKASLENPIKCFLKPDTLYWEFMHQPIIELKSDKQEYRLKINSGSYYSLRNKQSTFISDDVKVEDKNVIVARNLLKAYVYKISSTPELLYDVILNTWLADDSVISTKKFTVVGDCQIMFDQTSYEYVIRKAK